MGIVYCPHCGRGMSEKARLSYCLHCAYPFDAAAWRMANRRKLAAAVWQRHPSVGGLLTAYRDATGGEGREAVKEQGDGAGNRGISRTVAEICYWRWKSRHHTRLENYAKEIQ